MAGFQNPTSSFVAAAAGTLPNAAKFPALHTALARVLAGTGDSTILFVGDSIMSGLFGANIGSGPAIQIVRSMAAALGVPVSDGLAIPVSNNVAGPDNRWASGAGWTGGNIGGQPGTPGQSWGGLTTAGTVVGYFGANAAAGSLVFTPRTGLPSIDTFDVYSIGGSFSVNFNGGANTVVGALAGLQKTTVSGGVTPHPTCFISAPTGSGCIIIGVDARLSTTPTLRIGNAAVTASSTGNWVNTSASPNGPLDCIGFYNPNLVVVNLGGNDPQLSVPLSSSIANWTALATKAKACQGGTGGIIFASENPFNPAVTNGAQFPAYWATLQSFCTANGYGFIDIYNNLNGQAGFTPLTLTVPDYYGDGNSIHPSTTWQQDYGRQMANGLLAL